VKNNLATVQALARSTLRGSDDLSSFEEAFSARLEALGRTYGLLKSGPAAATNDELVQAELAPFGGSSEDRLTIAGPEVRLSSASAVAVGMILHELTTNASKDGALASDDGQLSICWRIDQGTVLLNWSEQCQPGAPGKKPGGGFGSKLIDRLVRQLRGTIDGAGNPPA
jgi:two-component sensor histidine kinase